MNVTEIWKKFEKAKDYINQKGIVRNTENCWNFYVGEQWKSKKSDSDMPDGLPVLNFIKPIIKYKVSTIAQHAMTAVFSDGEGKTGSEAIYAILNKKFAQSWEKAKMDSNIWKLVKQAAVQGDSYLYFGSDSTNEEPQLLSNTSIFFGDENKSNIQDQPYILISERIAIDTVKKIAKENGVKASDIKDIGTDKDTEMQIANKEEVDDKVTSILLLEKGEDGYISITKATKNCIYAPKRKLATEINGKQVGGQKLYPIVNFIWEEKPNSARGVSEVKGLIPNQIELNKTLARRAVTVKLTAYPRIAYDTNAIENPEDLEKAGAAIGINGGAQSVNQLISYLNAANISSDAQALSNDIMSITRELSGAGDYATGNINPERASGAAIIAVRDQTEVPLNEQVKNYTQTVEDVALVWCDIWTTYNANDFKVEETNEDGTTSSKRIPAEQIVNLVPSVRIDVSRDNQWSKMAEQQTLDNLLQNEKITFEEYVMMSPEHGSVPKGKLLQVLETRKKRQESLQGQAPPQEIEGEPQDGSFFINKNQGA